MENKRHSFSRRIDKSAKDLLTAREEEKGFWHYATRVGIGGWLFAIPVVAGAYLGRFLDRKIKGSTSWTVTFIMIGIAAGAYNLWKFLFRREDR